MTHNTRVRTSGNGWGSISETDFQKLDLNISQALNGVDGSTHGPTSVIHIGGPDPGLEVFGPTKVARGGSFTVQTAAGIVLQGGFPAWMTATQYNEGDVIVPTAPNGRRYLCTTPGETGGAEPTWPTAYTATVTDGTVVWTCLGPDGDYPQYSATHVGRSPTVVHSLAGGRPAIAGTWRVRNADGGVQAVAPMMDMSDGQGPQASKWRAQIRVHDTGTISSVTIGLRPGFAHTSLPSVMPGARLLRIAKNGIPQKLTSTAAGADARGFVYLQKPASAAAWSGPQTLTVPCDQFNVADLATYTYVLEVIDEQWPSGSGYPWSLLVLQPVQVAATGNLVAFTGLGTYDGYTLHDGDRILVKSQSPDDINVIWIAHSGAWGFAPDTTPLAPSAFVRGQVIPVLNGTVNGGSYWQADSRVVSWSGTGIAGQSASPPYVARGAADDETTLNTGSQFFAHGTIWFGAAVNYSGITAQVFQ